MNITKYISTGLLSAFVLTTASGAFANDKWIGDEGSNWQEHVRQSKSSLTREQVQNATIAAARRGEIKSGDEPMYPKTVTSSVRSRAEVHAEAVQAAHSASSALYIGG
ncbi:hypothetical protein [Actimicrobium antarcticum]|uniref:DUF4148 domain-containing protein n=1 Tax=Actimicrobium antarcticum TaxID=1051899 RepID=A0ABP7SI90_9BURK